MFLLVTEQISCCSLCYVENKSLHVAALPLSQYLDVLPVPLLGGLEEETRLVSTFLCHLAPPIEVLSVIVVVGNMQFLRQAQITGPLSLAVGRGVGEYRPLYVTR